VLGRDLDPAILDPPPFRLELRLAPPHFLGAPDRRLERGLGRRVFFFFFFFFFFFVILDFLFVCLLVFDFFLKEPQTSPPGTRTCSSRLLMSASIALTDCGGAFLRLGLGVIGAALRGVGPTIPPTVTDDRSRAIGVCAEGAPRSPRDRPRCIGEILTLRLTRIRGGPLPPTTPAPSPWSPNGDLRPGVAPANGSGERERDPSPEAPETPETPDRCRSARGVSNAEPAMLRALVWIRDSAAVSSLLLLWAPAPGGRFFFFLTFFSSARSAISRSRSFSLRRCDAKAGLAGIEVPAMTPGRYLATSERFIWGDFLKIFILYFFCQKYIYMKDAKSIAAYHQPPRRA
jgi:hypothetical protein